MAGGKLEGKRLFAKQGGSIYNWRRVFDLGHGFPLSTSFQSWPSGGHHVRTCNNRFE
jgi:hypothetical protein